MAWDRPVDEAIALARAHWESGCGLDAGRILYERVPRRLRPLWGASALRAASRFIPEIPEIEAVLAFAENPDKWGDGAENKEEQAHGFFDAARILALEYQDKDRPLESILILAENVAKVTYNAYGYPALFDHDAGWLIVAALMYIAEQVGDAEFTAEAWSLLSNKEYITLTGPVVCHPACLACAEWYLDEKPFAGQ